MKFKLTRKQKKMLYRIIAAGILLAAAAAITHFTELPWWADLLIFVVPYVVSGYDVLKTAAINLLHGQVFDEKFLMMVAGRRVIPEHRCRKIQEVHLEPHGHQT